MHDFDRHEISCPIHKDLPLSFPFTISIQFWVNQMKCGEAEAQHYKPAWILAIGRSCLVSWSLRPVISGTECAPPRNACTVTVAHDAIFRGWGSGGGCGWARLATLSCRHCGPNWHWTRNLDNKRGNMSHFLWPLENFDWQQGANVDAEIFKVQFWRSFSQANQTDDAHETIWVR